MTISFAVPSGVPLPHRYASRIFTATRELSYCCAHFVSGPQRPQEFVYRDGAFQWPYLESKREGDTYTIVRTGGWPRNLELRPKEVPEQSGAPSSFWDTLYEVDLRTLPSQSIPVGNSAYLSFVLDGQPWYAHTSNGSLAVVNGQGIVGSAQYDASGGNGYAGVHFGLRAYAMAGYDQTKQTAALVKYAGDLSASPGGQVLGASNWTGGENWGYGPGYTASILKATKSDVHFFATNQGAGPGLAYAAHPGEDWLEWTFATTAMPMVGMGSPDYTSLRTHARMGAVLRGGVDAYAVMPPMESLAGIGMRNGTGNGESSSLKIGFYAGSNNGVSIPFRATHIKVVQRAVP